MIITVFAHDSGQRFNWAYSKEAVEDDRKRWLAEVAKWNNMPPECVGPVVEIPLDAVDDFDVYVGAYPIV